MAQRDDLRAKALQNLQTFEVLMLNGHFDFGNGYHGPVYLNPHQLFRQPSTIWRFAQDLLDVIPGSYLDSIDVVAGPVMGGALLAHTMAGLLDSRRELTKPPMLFAPFRVGPNAEPSLSDFYGRQIAGKRVLLADDIRNTGQTLSRCADLIRQTGGTVVATCQIYDRLESIADVGVPNIALAEYRAPANYAADQCPLCKAGQAITTF